MAAFISSAVAAAGGASGVASIVSAGAGVASTISAVKQGNIAQKAQEEARGIQKAQMKIENKAARQRAAREERIRRARLLSSASSSGGGQQSSGYLGGSSALGSNFASAIARQRQQEKVSGSLSRLNQTAATAQYKYDRSKAFAGLTENVVDFASEMNWL